MPCFPQDSSQVSFIHIDIFVNDLIYYEGKLIGMYGTFLIALVGGIIFAGSSVILAIGVNFWNYVLGTNAY